MSKAEQEQVDVSGLEASLDELVKAADATDLVKGSTKNDWGSVNEEYSGRVDEDGKGGGGAAGKSDMGGLDDMMIGKMSDTAMAALAGAGFSADQIAGFMHGKAGDEEEDDEEMEGRASEESEEDEDDEEEEHGKAGKGFVPNQRPSPHGKAKGGMPMPPFTGKKAKKGEGEREMRKSMDMLRDDPAIADAVDVSAYLEGITARVAEQIDGLAKSLVGGQREQQGVNRKLAAAVFQIGTLVKSVARVSGALNERLKLVEMTPNAPKGKQDVRKAAGAAALQKGLPGEAGGPAAKGGQLRKSEIVSVLGYMGLERKIPTLPSGQGTLDAMKQFDTGEVIAPETVEAVHSFLRANPSEAQRALTWH